MDSTGAPLFDHVRLATPGADAAAHEWATLLGAPPTPLSSGGARFQFDRGALEVVAGAPTRSLGLCAPDGARAAAVRSPGGLEVRWTPVVAAVALGGAAPAQSPGAGRDGGGARDTGVAPDRIHAIDHVVVRTAAPDRAVALWRDAFGLRLALDREFPARGLRMLFFRSAGVTLEFVAPLGARDESVDDEIDGIAWQVADIDACRARLVAAGADVSEVRPGFKPGTRVATVRSAPGGLPTLVIEPAARPVS